MKTTVRFLAVVAFSATVLPLTAGAASAQTSVQPSVEPSVIPSQGNEDAVTAISPRGQEKHYEEMIVEAKQLGHDAAEDLHAGKYVQAEVEARQSLSLNPGDGVPAEVLAASLEGQSKDKEALEAYRVMVVDEKAMYPRVLLPYAQLLLKSGQWAQALAVYNQALPSLGHEELERMTSHFSPDEPQPAALATAIHLERGQLYSAATDWAGEAQDTEAMAEYQKALQLAPNNALTNYYYGVGWHKLSPAERVKFGTAQQAKAALQKAVKIGNANVKAAARKALKSAG